MVVSGLTRAVVDKKGCDDPYCVGGAVSRGIESMFAAVKSGMVAEDFLGLLRGETGGPRETYSNVRGWGHRNYAAKLSGSESRRPTPEN